MKTRKGEFITVLALLIGAAIMLSGCPAPITDPDDPGTVEPPPGGEAPQNEIRVERAPSNGTVDINPNTPRVAQGTTVTITLRPAVGFEPNNFTVYEFSTNRTIPTTNTAPNTYTFTMPASIAMIRAEFINITAKIANTTAVISTSSSWDEIGALNTLIKRARNPSAARARQTADDIRIINEAINKLVGTPASGTTAAVPGIIELKMRNEDLTTWLTLNKPPSYTIDKGVNNTNLTHLYYVIEDDPNIPALKPEMLKGWVEGARTTVENGEISNNQGDLHRVTKIPLTYEVGTGVDRKVVDYTILMWPSAQYTIQYDQNATRTAAVTIQDFYPARSGAGASDEAQTLNSSTTQRTGNVGNAALSISSNQNTTSSRPYVKIATTNTTIMITVTDSNGIVIEDGWFESPPLDPAGTPPTTPLQDPKSLNNITAQSLVAANTAAGGTGIFYPASRNYIIRVRPFATVNPASAK